MSLSRIPFQSVNESRIEAIVGIQTRPMCRAAGIPTITNATQRSRPSNWRRRPVLRSARDARGFWTWAWTAVANAAPASVREWKAPAAAQRRAQPALLGEDGLGLGLHVFEDPVNARRVRYEVRERLTGDVRGELGAGVAVEELGHCWRRGDCLHRLQLQRVVDRAVDIQRCRHGARVLGQIRLLGGRGTEVVKELFGGGRVLR